MKKALILSVGTGTRPDTNIVNPLFKTIKNSRPDYVGFLVSTDSRKFALEILDRFEPDEYEHGIVDLPNPDKIDEVFLAANRLIRDLMAAGYACEDIAVDYTSGTKAMTAGLVLSAVAYSCGELKYITGQRRNGVVIDGTEQFLTISPSAILAHRELRIARRLILAYRFNSALDLLGGLNTALLDDYDQCLLENLLHIARAYLCWDKFDHARFRGEYNQVDFTLWEMTEFQIDPLTNACLKSVMEAMKKGRLNEDVLADLYNNAARRHEEGKYDDAMARMYRLLEMLGQWALSSHGLNSSDLDPAGLSPDLQSALSVNRDPADGRIKIGLIKTWQVLADLGSDMGRAILEDQALRARLNSRNYSILAHGTRPVEEKECRSLLQLIRDYLVRFVPEAEERLSRLRFPWSKNQSD